MAKNNLSQELAELEDMSFSIQKEIDKAESNDGSDKWIQFLKNRQSEIVNEILAVEDILRIAPVRTGSKSL